MIYQNLLTLSAYSPSSFTSISEDEKTNTPSPIVTNPIYRLLEKNGIVDEKGNVKSDYERKLPKYLNEIQLKRLNAIIQSPLKIRVGTVTLSITLKELFIFIGKESIEIIGGSVFWILGKEYIAEVLDVFKIAKKELPENFLEEFDKPASDIDIRVLLDQKEDPSTFREKTITFFHKKLPDWTIKKIEEECFTKSYTQAGDNTLFSVVAFGNNENLSIDLIFVKQLKRAYLFQHDALKIAVSYLAHNFRTNTLCSNHTSIAQPTVCRISKTLTTENPEEIDLAGACRLFAYLAKGWSYSSKKLESTLLSKIYSTDVFCDKLKKTAYNHFSKDSVAPFVLFFYARLFLPKSKENDFIPLIQKSLFAFETEYLKKDSFSFIFIKCFKKTLKTPLNQGAFNSFKACLQISSFLQFVFQEKKESNKNFIISEIEIKKTRHFKIEFPSLSTLNLIVDDHITEALDILRLSTPDTKNTLFPLFLNFMTFLKLHEKDIESLQEPKLTEKNCTFLSKVAFEFLENENFFLKELGFYLLTYSGIQTKTSSYLCFLFQHMLKIISQTVSLTARKNIFSCFLRYWKSVLTQDVLRHLEELENLYALISTKDFNQNEIKENICSCFSKCGVFFSNSIFSLWEKQEIILHDETLISLIHTLIPVNPPHALKLMTELLKNKLNSDKTKALLCKLIIEYKKEKHALLLERDLQILIEHTINLVAFIPPCKQKSNTNEVDSFLFIIENLLFTDYLKSIKLMNELENKNIILKPFNLILEKFDVEKKAFLILKKIELSNSKSKDQIEKELEFILSILKELRKTSPSYEEIHFKLIKYLSIISSTPIKFTVANLIKKNLDFLFINFLFSKTKFEQAVTLYFKLQDLVFSENLLKEQQLIDLAKTFFTFLTTSKNPHSSLQFTTSIVEKLKKAPNTGFSPEEILLYHTIFKIAQETKSIKIASTYFRKILLSKKTDNSDWDDKIIDYLPGLLSWLMENQNDEALSLFYLFKTQFPKANILDENNIWKKFILGLSEKAPKKAWDILSDKHLHFKDDQDIKIKAEQLLLDHLKNYSSIEKKLLFFEQVVTLIKTFNLNREALITALKVPLLKINDSKITLMLISQFAEIKTPYCDLTFFFEILLNQSSSSFQKFLNDLDPIFNEISNEKIESKKRDFIYIMNLGFLKVAKETKNNLSQIYLAIKRLQKLTTSDTSGNYYVLFCLEYIRIFNFFDHPEANTEICEKIDSLALLLIQRKEKNLFTIKDLLKFLLNVVFISGKHRNDVSPLELMPNLLTQIDNEFKKRDSQECQDLFLPFLEAVPKLYSPHVMLVSIYFCSLTLLNITPLKQEKNKKLTPFPKFKKALQNILFTAFNNSYYQLAIVELINHDFFSIQEKTILFDQFSSAHFKFNPEYLKLSRKNNITNKEKKTIISNSLTVYAERLKLPLRMVEIEERNCTSAAESLLALLLLGCSEDEYLFELKKILEPLISKSKKRTSLENFIKCNSVSYDFINYFDLAAEARSSNSVDKAIYSFFINFSNAMSSIFIRFKEEKEKEKEKEKMPPLALKVFLSNITHLHYLTFLPVDSNFILCCLNYIPVLMSVDEKSFHESFPGIKKFCHEILKNQKLFRENSTIELYVILATITQFRIEQLTIKNSSKKMIEKVYTTIHKIIDLGSMEGFILAYSILRNNQNFLMSQNEREFVNKLVLILGIFKLKFPHKECAVTFLENSIVHLYSDITFPENFVENKENFLRPSSDVLH